MSASDRLHPRGVQRRRIRFNKASDRPIFSAILGLSLTVSIARAEAPLADPYELLDQIGETLSIVEREYFEPADQRELLTGAVKGMVAELDPHSEFLGRSDLALFNGSTSGKFGGIGVEVEFADDEVIVIAPVDGSPADRAGIRSGDRIVALDGRPLAGQKPQEVVRLMRGAVGTSLRLTIRSQAGKRLREVDVQRELIAVASVTSTLLSGDIAYVRIKAFQAGTHREFLEALGQLRGEAGELQGLVLDLRNNPGGLVNEAAALSDEFLSRGTIFSTRHRGRMLETARAHRGGAFVEGPVAVLINEFSASAAELVAGALRDSGRAQLVGATSFGKGSVQTVIPLGHGGALKLTTALYYTPSGRTTQAVGVSPHWLVDPGYAAGAQLPVQKESDLAGHLLESPNAQVSPKNGPPPTNDELHLGVAREVPRDPQGSGDLALRFAYRFLRGLPTSP